MDQCRHARVPGLIHSVVGQLAHVPFLGLSQTVKQPREVILKVAVFVSFLLGLLDKTAQPHLHLPQLLGHSEGGRLASHQRLVHVGVDFNAAYNQM